MGANEERMRLRDKQLEIDGLRRKLTFLNAIVTSEENPRLQSMYQKLIESLQVQVAECERGRENISVRLSRLEKK